MTKKEIFHTHLEIQNSEIFIGLDMSRVNNPSELTYRGGQG